MLGWAVVGTGAHATGRLMPAITHAAETLPAAICSRDLTRAEELARKYGFSRAYDSYSRLLLDDSVHVVYLCTPNSLHAEQTIQAARAGKHVLVEKPMALTTADAMAMVNACDSAGVKLGVGFHFRHHPAQPEARRLIESGALGRMFLLDARMVAAAPRREGWWQDPTMIGGYIMGARGCHLVDLLCYLTNSEPVSVSMLTDGLRPDRPLEETAVGMFEFPGDTIATFVGTRHGDGAPNTFTAYGHDGFVQGTDTFGPFGSGQLRWTAGGATAEVSYQRKDPFREEVQSFNRSIVEGLVPSASGIDGLRVVRVTEALMESARSGQAVKLSGF